MNIRILKKSFGGEFVPERDMLRLGGKGSAKVETLVFELPPEWQGKAVTIHVQHPDGTLPSPILLDGENSAAVDKTFTASAKGLWMLKAVDTGGYCALTRPSKYECYETFSTEGEEEITPSMYEAFVAQVAENARQAKAAAKQAAENAEGVQENADRAEAAAARAVEKADGVETFASAAKESAAAAKQSEESCAGNAEAAKKSEDAAANSQTAAAESAATAASGASSAAASAGEAASSASAAEQSKTTAASSAETATTSADAAKKSEENAAASAVQAKSDAETAKAAADKATAANATDKTLTIEGVPADSKTVGDALSDRYTKSEVYTRTEVNQQIANASVETDKTLTVSGAAADAAATGNAVTALNAEVRYLKLKVSTDVTKNPFTVSFGTLDDVTMTGVWNTADARIEF